MTSVNRKIALQLDNLKIITHAIIKWQLGNLINNKCFFFNNKMTALVHGWVIFLHYLGPLGHFGLREGPETGKGTLGPKPLEFPAASFSRFQRSCTSYIALNPSAFAFCVHIMDTQSNVTSTAELESHWAKYSFLSTNFNPYVFVNG